MRENKIEVFFGAIVIAVALFFFVFAYKATNISSSQDGYEIIAKFDRVDGLVNGSDVRISGVKIGSIRKLSLDKSAYLATAHIIISKDVPVPVDSTAEIISDGLLGSKYLSIMPGASEQNLKNGEQIQRTQAAVNFESLIGKFLFNNDKK